MSKGKIEVKSKDADGKDITVYVVRPSSDDYTNAQIEASKAFKNAIFSGAMLKRKLEEFLVEQGIWNSEKENRLEECDKQVLDGLTKLKKGGIKLSEAKDIAIKVRVARMNRALLLTSRSEYDDFTVEAQAENAKFNYLVSVCVKDEEGNCIFKDLDDYKNRANEPFAELSASKLATLIHGLDDNWESELPENQFLKKYGFVNDDLRLVNKEGKYVTSDGKIIDENFRYVDENGNFVDEDGIPIDKDGLPMVEHSPFLDDEGNPISDEEDENTKKRGRPRKSGSE